MPPILAIALRSRATVVVLVALILAALTGCGTASHRASGSPVSRINANSKATAPIAQAPIPAVRYSRYTLVELIPERSQEDLMQQVVDITLPPSANATVGEALRYLLLRTGYQLCDHPQAGQILDALPVPAAHIHLGPLPLHEALRVLVGPAWSLQVDERTRRVCFESGKTNSDTPPLSKNPAN